MKVEEAKTKECPYCILFTEQGLNGKGLIVNDYIYSRCKANACMAWRWNDPSIKNEGYCGLAGKEGAE